MRSILTTLAFLLGIGSLAASPALAQNRFWLVNNSGVTIEQAYVSPSRLSDWGSDILGRSTVAAGDQVRVSPAARDCELDIKVVYEGGQEEEKMKVNACNISRIVFTNPNGQANSGGGAGGTIETAAGGAGGTISRGPGADATASRPGRSGEASFNFVNRTTDTIQELYVSGSRDDNWGRDRLGRDTLAAGQRRRVEMPGTGCNVDIRVVFDGGRAQERRNVATCDRGEISWP